MCFLSILTCHEVVFCHAAINKLIPWHDDSQMRHVDIFALYSTTGSYDGLFIGPSDSSSPADICVEPIKDISPSKIILLFLSFVADNQWQQGWESDIVLARAWKK